MDTSLHSPDSIAQLADDALHDNVRALVGRSNQLLAALLAHLAEVHARGIHRARACPTLTAYCIYELRMSEDAAHKRARAAAIAREFPVLFGMLAAGEIHLTGVLMLGPHLTAANQADVLARARFRTKREIAQLIARIAPQADVPALVEPIAPAPEIRRRTTWARFIAGLARPVRSLPAGQKPGDWVGDGDALALLEGESATETEGATEAERTTERESAIAESATERESERERGAAHHPARADGDATPSGDPAAHRTISAPERNVAPLRYKIQFSASQEYVELLGRASDLLSHEVPTRDLEQVQLRAMRALVAQLEKRRCGATEAPRTEAPRTEPLRTKPQGAGADAPLRPTRHVPAAVRREVWARDAGRCTYVDERGQRCRETAFVELHHREPHVRGGPPTAENLRLTCRAHNGLAAESDFGRAFMQRKVAERRLAAGVDTG